MGEALESMGVNLEEGIKSTLKTTVWPPQKQPQSSAVTTFKEASSSLRQLQPQPTLKRTDLRKIATSWNVDFAHLEAAYKQLDADLNSAERVITHVSSCVYCTYRVSGIGHFVLECCSFLLVKNW
jgi:hypothetical protein